jgi:N-acetylated-alpha-linked acidic dipeptidase
VPPFLNFAPLQNGVESLQHSAQRYAAAQAKWQGLAGPSTSASLAALNADLIQIQRSFLNQTGLPERPWFKHQVYAPGAYTGYGAKPIAAVREYMDQKKWKEAEEQVPAIGKMLEDAARRIATAADELDKLASEQR